MHTKHGVPWPLAAHVGVVLLGPAMGGAREQIGRPLAVTLLRDGEVRRLEVTAEARPAA